MRNVCLIPARSGSKGLKDKNMAYLNSKPVLQHTIEAAKNSGCFANEDIYVSTDSKSYIEHLGDLGITMLYRDPELATDNSTTADVVINFLESFDEEVTLCLLQPTSPLRTGKHIAEAFCKYDDEKGLKTVVSISEVDKSPNLMTELGEDGKLKDIVGVDKGYRRQNYSQLYAPNGAIFITSKSSYTKEQSFFTDDTVGYIMDKKSSIDIDDYNDFVKAIGAIFFDYNRREVENYPIYEERLVTNLKDSNSKIIIGDSRTEPLVIDGYLNLSMGGVTANTMLSLVRKHINPSDISEVIINLGVNDIIVGYTKEEQKTALKGLIEFFKDANVKICNIFPTIYRPNVDNDVIVEINQFINDKLEVEVINTYSLFEVDKKLDFNLTYDGLHLTPEGNLKLKSLLDEAISK